MNIAIITDVCPFISKWAASIIRKLRCHITSETVCPCDLLFGMRSQGERVRNDRMALLLYLELPIPIMYLPYGTVAYVTVVYNSKDIHACTHLRVYSIYRKVSNIRRTLEDNKIVDHSDVVGASPVGAAPTTSSLSTEHLASMDLAKTTARRYEKKLCLGIGCVLYQRIDGSDSGIGTRTFDRIAHGKLLYSHKTSN